MIKTGNEQKCLWCDKVLKGNDNKKYCSDSHKNAFHNERRKSENKLIGEIIAVLKSNRRILDLVLEGKAVKRVRLQSLQEKGFIFKYRTHQRKNKGDQREYIFCFECGYCELDDGWVMVVKEG